jgi:hypothetical protein
MKEGRFLKIPMQKPRAAFLWRQSEHLLKDGRYTARRAHFKIGFGAVTQ